MATTTPASVALGAPPATPAGNRKRKRHSIHGREGMWGWIFVTPALLGLLVFLVIPIFMAFYVSLLDWDGQSNPLSGESEFVGFGNYAQLLTEDKLTRQDFARSLRNNFYFVLGVVPLQTALSLFLAVIVNQRFLKGKSFFRTAFYFPSITSSIAIALVFIFMFQNKGVVNAVLGLVGITGPAWFADRRGLLHILFGLFGVDKPPAAMQGKVFSLPLWEWIAGPSVAMCAIMMLVIWTTAGTFMLMFLAGLQNASAETDEAAMVDGAGPWQRFRYITVPMLKPTLYLVITLGIIGTWQVFDQIYVMSSGNPAKTTLTPAFLSYQKGFIDGKFGLASAMAFVLFALIIFLTLVQRFVMRDKEDAR